MTSYIIYGFAASTYVRTVRMAFAEKDVPYDLVPVDILKGETRTPEHLARHPFGKIPVCAIDNKTRVYETSAILEVIEGNHPEPALFPQELIERARMRQWMSVIDSYFYPVALRKLVWERLIKPMLDEKPDEQIIRDALPDVQHQFDLFDRQLKSTEYLSGTSLSAADLYLAPLMGYIAQTPEGQELIGRTGNLGKWWDTMQNRESYIATNPA